MINVNDLAGLAALRAIDLHTGRLLARLDGNRCAVLPLLAALTSWAIGQGHTCLPLEAVAGLLHDFGLDDHAWQDVAALRDQLMQSDMVGQSGAATPLILDGDQLFLCRHHVWEQQIAQALCSRAAMNLAVETDAARPLLERLFAVGDANTIDWQRAAAILALTKPLVVISGGPGTGKTYTVARILALLSGLTPQPLRIALVAPTGKAALRLYESLQQARDGLAELSSLIPDIQAQTLHRLLGFQVHRPGFRHDRTNPLHLDLLVVDEASMIDVGLMAALLEALPPHCRIILLGDRDQLASVEAGNLFGDLCGNGEIGWSAELRQQVQPLLGTTAALPSPSPAHPLADSLVLLRTSRRFAAGSGIGALALAINSGEAEAVRRVLGMDWTDVEMLDTAQAEQARCLRERVLAFLEPLFTADSPESALLALGERRILCALREGPNSVDGINRLAQAHLRRLRHVGPETLSYAGMPLLITRNDYGLGLFNGDSGVLWPDGQGQLRGWFGQEGGGLRSFSLARLPAWQPAYAMTVHKSQGSEFDRVLLLLPQEDAPVLTRELLYTGLTRARHGLILCGPLDLLLRTTGRRVIRYSGLAGKLAAGLAR